MARMPEPRRKTGLSLMTNGDSLSCLNGREDIIRNTGESPARLMFCWGFLCLDGRIFVPLRAVFFEGVKKLEELSR